MVVSVLHSLLAVVVAYVAYYLLTGVYHVWFGPMRSFPGPKSWVAFPIVRHIVILRGLEEQKLLEYHKLWGPVVRVGPKEVSFNGPTAWQDIYGHGHKQMEKSIFFKAPDGMPEHLISASSHDHSRYRKSMSNAFSEKVIKKQEELIRGYVQLFIQRLSDTAWGSGRVDIVKWLHLVTFDLIGDLAFGESFEGLQKSQEHDYVKTMFMFIKSGAWLRVFHEYQVLEKVALYLTPRHLREANHAQWQFTKDITTRRINNKEQQGRGDFMDAMVEHRNKAGGLSDLEIIVNANILISAGAETSATTLAGTIFFLMQNPDIMAKVQEEVRSQFSHIDQITFQSSTSQLPYMIACITEGMRRFPPLPSTLPRITNPGAPTTICGREVPPNTVVGVNQVATYLDPHNFARPESYVPERWLPEINSDPSSEFYHDNRQVFQLFSVGPRNCIGRNLAYSETRTILAKLLYAFDFELSPENKDWSSQKTWFWWDKPPLWCNIRLHNAEKKEVNNPTMNQIVV